LGSDGLAFTEALVVEDMGDGLWRLGESPAWSKYAAWHDVVEADWEDGELIVRRVVEHSGCRTVRLFVPRRFPMSAAGMALCERLLGAGGMWEMYSEGFLILNFPAEGDVDWDAALEEALEVFEREPPMNAEEGG
jgi:hypothetical protein